ncbi:Pentatricopeptide repeat-containing protein [Platanthera zijinensis]|uniref:Pentatricopeptide repeat-containing protein n=1 Tax=Platanthera zijinensis TaxID=2320716 RepID=A0AAP0B7C4_9ASPA
MEVFREAGDLVSQDCDSHVISAMAEFDGLEEGRRKGSEIHGRVIRTGFIDSRIAVSNGLVTMYSKCGSINRALSVFKCTRARDEVSWNSMVAGSTRMAISRRL